MEWISDISNQISGSSWVPQVSVLYLGLGFSFPLPTPSPVEPLLECGSLLPLLRGEHWRLDDRLGGGAGIAKEAASRRTPKCPRTLSGYCVSRAQPRLAQCHAPALLRTEK